MSSLLIVGAKGFAKELLQAVIQNEPGRDVSFFDDISTDLPEKLYERFPVFTDRERVLDYFDRLSPNFALGIGDPKLRKRFFTEFSLLGGIPETIISPLASIGSFGNRIGEGTVIMAGSILTNDIEIGSGCLINLNVTIGHDTQIGNFCEFSPGVHVSGHVCIGAMSNLGTGAVILPGVTLGSEVTVGAGAVVTKDVPNMQTVVGIPAKSRQ